MYKVRFKAYIHQSIFKLLQTHSEQTVSVKRHP